MISLKFERSVVSIFALVFLRNGCTTACLRLAGMVPIRREVLIMVKTLGPIMSKTSLKRREGIMLR